MDAVHFGSKARAWVRSSTRIALSAVVVAVLVACGGAKNDQSDPASPPPTGTDVPASREAAAHFLTQATFGPTDASVNRVMALGYSQWIDEQLGKPVTSHQTAWEALDQQAKAASPDNTSATVGQDGVFHSFWRAAVTGDDQLRQRVAFALSEIFVISMQDGNVGDNPHAVAAYMDMLATKGLGNYRDLIEAVSLHPMMGQYLTSLTNRKADPKTGRVPDENYAREVMQLFSIGLLQLNADGSVKTNGTSALETYTPADIAGLAKVFTGWSWTCPVAPTLTNSTCFYNGTTNNTSDPDRMIKPMINYPQFHSTEEKSFLGAVIPAQKAADPKDATKTIDAPNGAASLKVALDTITAHPNVGPFISKLLIQRLVTSNPSPTYVGDVAAVFNGSNGTRGDMRAVVKAILTHPESRVVTTKSGKVREPILRMTALLRAFPFSSDSGYFKIGNTDNPGSQLGQSAMRSPTVFNFYRPGYVAPGTNAAAAGLVAPEMQLAHETTAAGYVNFMRDALSGNVGQSGGTPVRRDLQVDFSAELALADKPSAANPADLVERVNQKLMYGTMPEALKAQINAAVASIAIPASNQTNIDSAKRNRVNSAIFLALVSPEYQVQK